MTLDFSIFCATQLKSYSSFIGVIRNCWKNYSESNNFKFWISVWNLSSVPFNLICLKIGLTQNFLCIFFSIKRQLFLLFMNNYNNKNVSNISIMSIMSSTDRLLNWLWIKSENWKAQVFPENFLSKINQVGIHLKRPINGKNKK